MRINSGPALGRGGKAHHARQRVSSCRAAAAGRPSGSIRSPRRRRSSRAGRRQPIRPRPNAHGNGQPQRRAGRSSAHAAKPRIGNLSPIPKAQFQQPGRFIARSGSGVGWASPTHFRSGGQCPDHSIRWAAPTLRLWFIVPRRRAKSSKRQKFARRRAAAQVVGCRRLGRHAARPAVSRASEAGSTRTPIGQIGEVLHGHAPPTVAASRLIDPPPLGHNERFLRPLSHSLPRRLHRCNELGSR